MLPSSVVRSPLSVVQKTEHCSLRLGGMPAPYLFSTTPSAFGIHPFINEGEVAMLILELMRPKGNPVKKIPAIPLRLCASARKPKKAQQCPPHFCASARDKKNTKFPKFLLKCVGGFAKVFQFISGTRRI